MIRNLFLYILLTLCIYSCKTNKYVFYGEKFDLNPITSFESMVSQIAKTDSFETPVLARVESVCQAKGCWINLSSPGDKEVPQLFVQFKDYGFFVPGDIAGKEAIIKGMVYRELTSVEDLRHYAKDEGKSEEEIALINDPVEELKIMASGVAIKRD